MQLNTAILENRLILNWLDYCAFIWLSATIMIFFVAFELWIVISDTILNIIKFQQHEQASGCYCISNTKGGILAYTADYREHWYGLVKLYNLFGYTKYTYMWSALQS